MVPLTAHSDTVSRCGVFCSFISGMECCKTEGIVDVFQVVKAIRIQKPGSVLTVVSNLFVSLASYIQLNPWLTISQFSNNHTVYAG